MTTTITKKIVGFSVATADAPAAPVSSTPTDSIPVDPAHALAASAPAHAIMGEHIDRPDVLSGRTYKIGKSPANENALYVTINDIVLNPGTAHEQHRPFEIFINSKNMAEFQWIVAMTRIMSAVFRKGGDVSFLVEEMKAVFDPNGGYWRPGGQFKSSLVAEIGDVIEQHLQSIGMIERQAVDPALAALLDEKRRAVSGTPNTASSAAPSSDESNGSSFPPSATLCPKCHTKALVILDGCKTCLNCGDSKCG